MKTKLTLILSTALFSLLLSPAFAQEPPKPDASPAAPGAPGGSGGGRRGMNQNMQNFSPEEREKLKAAREKAMQDPKVQDAQENMKAASEALRAARKKALLAQDPDLGPILEKLEAAQKQNLPGPKPDVKPDAKAGTPDGGDKPGAKAGSPDRGGRRMDLLGSLTPEEREKFKAANEKIKDNPEVVSAREKAQQADKQFFSALRDAMLAADPSLEPLLKKMEEARQQRQDRREGEPPVAKP